MYKLLAIVALLLAQDVYALDSGGQAAAPRDSVNSNFSCPAASFKDFLSHFINSEEARKANSNPALEIHDLVLQKADQAQIYRTTIVSRETVLPAAFDNTLILKKGILIDWIKPKSAQAYSVDAQHPEIRRRFLFAKKNECWILVSIFNDLIPSPVVLSERSQKKAENCLRTAEKYESIASRTGDANYFDRALYAFLCAAQNGSAQSAIRAAQLGASGQSRALPSDHIEKLFLQAAGQGLSNAMTALAELKCGDLAVCAEPTESYSYLSRAILAGNHEAINTLGVWLERGKLGITDTSRALSCYRLAASRGSKLAVANIERLSAGRREIETADCPVASSLPSHVLQPIG